MSLPDPAALDAIAERIAHHAVLARARSAGLGAVVAGLEWQGAAANAFRGQAGGIVTGLHVAAGRLDDAAAALRRHAHSVGTVMSDLAAVGLGGLHTVEDVLTHPGAGLADGGLLLGVTGRALGGLGRLVGLG